MSEAPARLVDIANIDVPKRLRPTDDAWVEVLAASMETNGLEQPIKCNIPDALRVPDVLDRVELVYGAHRLEAAKRLGWTSIEAKLSSVSRDEARLVEIDENLLRNELSALDRAIFLAERQDVWQRLHPQTTRGGNRGNQHTGGIKRQTANLAFSQNVADQVGLSERTIRRAVALAKGLDIEARDLLRGHPISKNESQLRALAMLPAREQLRIAAALSSGNARSLAEAVPGKALKSADDRAFEVLLKAWQRAGAKARRRFLAEIGSVAE